MIAPKTKCDQCGKSLICEHCGGFKWKQAVMEDNAVSPWWFCSEKCRQKFMDSADEVEVAEKKLRRASSLTRKR